MKKLAKFIAIGMLIMSLGLFTGCRDYGYEFHFSVVGGNGTVVHRWRESTASEWQYEHSPVSLRGNKNGQQIELTAIPDNGYQVKQWVCDGEIVVDNKTTSLTAVAVDINHNKVVVTVEFEPIP